MSRLKGQVFLLGGFLLVIIFAAGAGVLSLRAIDSGTLSIEKTAENVASEAARAANFGLISEGNADKLADFLLRARNYSQAKGFVLEGFFVVLVPDGGNIKAYSGNYLGKIANITVSIASDTKGFELSDGSHESKTYSNVGSDYNANITEGGYSNTFEWPISKANGYMELSFTDGKNTVKKNVIF